MIARLSQGERIVLLACILLIVDLLVFPWHDAQLDAEAGRLAEAVGFDPTPSGVQSPNGGYGIAALILTLVMIAQIVAAKLLSLRLPEPPVPWHQIHLVAGVFVPVVLIIKLIREPDFLGYGAYSGILAALLVAFGGYSINQERATHV